jgi:hypothetical protein
MAVTAVLAGFLFFILAVEKAQSISFPSNALLSCF